MPSLPEQERPGVPQLLWLPPLLQVYAELSWDLERAALQLDKLQAFFLAEVEAEHAMLHGFRSGACLASFRLLALPQGEPGGEWEGEAL